MYYIFTVDFNKLLKRLVCLVVSLLSISVWYWYFRRYRLSLKTVRNQCSQNSSIFHFVLSIFLRKFRSYLSKFPFDSRASSFNWKVFSCRKRLLKDVQDTQYSRKIRNSDIRKFIISFGNPTQSVGNKKNFLYVNLSAMKPEVFCFFHKSFTENFEKKVTFKTYVLLDLRQQRSPHMNASMTISNSEFQGRFFHGFERISCHLLSGFSSTTFTSPIFLKQLLWSSLCSSRSCFRPSILWTINSK